MNNLFLYTGQLPDKSQGLPTGTRNDMNDNQTFRNPSFAESRKTADLLADIYQSNNIQTSQRESCSSLDSTDQNQDEEYLSANIQNISLNAGNFILFWLNLSTLPVLNNFREWSVDIQNISLNR